tara:strand:- start:1074 stop:1352 length:279 start_codon:yes stop_codon:yes gene_type:complete
MAANNPAVGTAIGVDDPWASFDYSSFTPPPQQIKQQPEQQQAPTLANKEARKQKIRSALKGMADARPAPIQPLLQLPESRAPGPKEIDFMEA